ncbi:hypothetical protein C8Q80DRAFT_1265522 [Daedaleopsis nitida]|nr:hypothetical protein C8Q80DRAFT_1265522 [Daedaleopsis nitida]
MARMNTATLSSGVRNPIREIHLTTGEFTPAEKLLRWNTILQNRCSTLETFSFSIPNDVFPPEHAVPLALSEVHTPELRHVYLYRPVKSLLWDGVLPKLTHLAIWKLTALDSLATILTHCPSLESLSLMDLCDLDTTRRPVARTIGPSSRLRRILLYDTWNGDMQDAVLALLQGTQPYRALQIYYRASGYNFSYDSICRVRVQCHILERPVRLEVGMYVSSPQWPNGKAICGHLTVTAVTSKNCYRVGRRWQLGNDSPLPWVPQMLSPEEGLSDVRELWLVNITENVAQYAIVAKTLPALETIALVFDIYPVRSHAWSATVTPDLSILPHVYWPDHCPSLNTLRIICGFSDYRETVQQVACIRNEEMGVPRLDLSRVLAQLRSQSSKYSGNLEHIVIQATPQVAVNSDELKQLERYFTTVRLEYVDELPSMPLPEYCVEPEMNVSQKWRGLLW